MPEVSPPVWDQFLARHPDAHLLQTSAWGLLKSGFGWQPVSILSPGGEMGAQVLFRHLPFGLTVAYIPKGPVGSGEGAQGLPDWGVLWTEVDKVCRQRRAIFLKVEPDYWEPQSVDDQRQTAPVGFSFSRQDIQPPRTLLVDLRGSEDDILGRMKQKTRYNVRLALKKGIVVYPSADLGVFYRLMAVTGQRDVFGVHSRAYYQRAFELFHPQGECEILMAAFEGQPVASLMVFARGQRAWYFYGASADEQRERMPTYLLQWEAMRWARSRGCSQYDLWGVPDAAEQTLEADFA
jgi:lipid II:glycine glycyltransferase (peptidoglycan interpeptide bridge formation enzyme)